MAALPRLRLVQFAVEGRQRIGALTRQDGDVVDICAVDPTIPSSMKELLNGGDQSLLAAQKALEKAQAAKKNIFPKGSFALKAPICDPQKNLPVPEEPIIFSKFSSAITDPNGPVQLSEETKELDFEVELAIVIGKSGKKIPEAEAMSHVVGFTVAHDVSARDWQLRRNGGQWLIGKTFDTFCPIGPAIVTRGAISDPHNLGIRCRLNGELVQNSNTNQLVHKTESLIAFTSRFMTLKPGDLILTGTPPGVGCFRKPPVWLKRGDSVECEIDEIGVIRNEIV